MTVLPLDIADETSTGATAGATLDQFNTIDVLVNGAGCGLFGPLEGATAGEREAQFQTNVFGIAVMIRHVLPRLRERRSRTIVNLSWTGGRMAAPFGPGTYARKFALADLSESPRHELSLHKLKRASGPEPTDPP